MLQARKPCPQKKDSREEWKQIRLPTTKRSCGPMDKASAYGAGVLPGSYMCPPLRHCLHWCPALQENHAKVAREKGAQSSAPGGASTACGGAGSFAALSARASLQQIGACDACWQQPCMWGSGLWRAALHCRITWPLSPAPHCRSKPGNLQNIGPDNLEAPPKRIVVCLGRHLASAQCPLASPL